MYKFIVTSIFFCGKWFFHFSVAKKFLNIHHFVLYEQNQNVMVYQELFSGTLTMTLSKQPVTGHHGQTVA